MEKMDEIALPAEYDLSVLTQDRAKCRKRTRALRQSEFEEMEEEMMFRQAVEAKRRNEELQNQIDVMNMAVRISDLETWRYEVAMACRNQRIKEFKLLLGLVRSDEEKLLQVQSDYDDFLKTEVTFTPTFNFMACAGMSCSNSLRTPQRAVSQKQEHSSTRCSALEDADRSSPHGNEEGLIDSISLKPSKKRSRK